MRVVVTGAKGQLGSDLVEVLRGDHEVIGLDRGECDVADPGSKEILRTCRPDLVIHTAAYTDVDGCELNPQKAYRVNALGTKHVAEACKALDVPMVYISTDYVFDGKKGKPYTESDAPNPINIYGRSKLEGERFIRSLLEPFYIIRTAWLYGRGGRNFVKTILQKAQRGEVVRVVDDQVGSPTYSRDLAKAMACLIEGAPFGTYHLTNSGSCSWYEFAERIFALAGLRGSDLIPIPSQELGRPAPRPSYSVLANDHWLKVMDQKLRSWQEALEEALSVVILSEAENLHRGGKSE